MWERDIARLACKSRKGEGQSLRRNQLFEPQPTLIRRSAPGFPPAGRRHSEYCAENRQPPLQGEANRGAPDLSSAARRQLGGTPIRALPIRNLVPMVLESLSIEPAHP